MPKLYHSNRSVCALKLRLLVAQKGLEMVEHTQCGCVPTVVARKSGR